MGQDEPWASVIVPFFNAQDTISDCFSSLAAQKDTPKEVLMIDNASTDRSKDIVRARIEKENDPAFRLMSESKKGPSAARNTAARNARGSWLLFTDSDCIADPAWAHCFLRQAEQGRLGAIAGSIKPAEAGNVVQKFQSLFSLQEQEREETFSSYTIDSGLFPTANLAVKKEVFDHIGGFDECLHVGEDHDLCARIYKAGYRIRTAPDAVVFHVHTRKLKTMITKSYRMGVSQAHKLKMLFQPGSVFVRAPFFRANRSWKHQSVWIDLTQADKKMAFLLLPALFKGALFLLPMAYFFYLCFFIRKIAAKRSVPLKLIDLPLLALLLLFKSMLLTAGRLMGSLSNKVICL
jgi:GT2 family glycosyltransferase